MEPSLLLSSCFILITLLTAGFFWHSSRYDLKVICVLLVWMLLHGILAYVGFYLNTETIPPRIFLTFGPALLFIVVLFYSTTGRQWIRRLNIKTLTLIHIVRVPVELVLYGLFIHNAIPELMTFTGRNPDILAGLTCPLIFYLTFFKRKIGKRGLLIWNIVALVLLSNIVVQAILSSPLPFQQFALEQPNIAVLHFPFVWLPAVVVPLVFISHLVVIVQLVDPKTSI